MSRTPRGFSSSSRALSGFVLWMLIFILALSLSAQGVYERGTFVSFPAGKHVNYIFQGTWNTYIAVEDGLLVYDHHNERWLEPITASNGLNQYPALLVWQDPGSQEVWIVTPDYLFIYDQGSGWMQRENLPQENIFTGEYSMGITPQRVLITARSPNVDQGYSAVYLRNSGKFEQLGADSSLAIDWNTVTYYGNEDYAAGSRDLFGKGSIAGGSFDVNGTIHLDGYPQKTGAVISAMSTSQSGESFLGTQGIGVFFQEMRGGRWVQKPFGLLTPDVMSLAMKDSLLLIGGRAGLTVLDGFEPSYSEAIADPVFDYSFISAVTASATKIFIAGRNGVFRKLLAAQNWERMVKKDDLKSKRIYSLASGSHGNLMIGTEKNAYLYHESGLILASVFPANSNWAVYHSTYSRGKFYLATVFGLYVYDEDAQAFTARISSQGEVQSPRSSAALDPIYRTAIADSVLWATTSRGLIRIDQRTNEGQSYLSPFTPFKPRGLIIHGQWVWLGSESGLYSFDPKTDSWRQYSRNDGLVSDFITDLVGRGDYIWVGSNLGLTRVSWRNL